MDIRPSSDQVREGLFNMLSALADFKSMIFLDLYAGTGTLGIEALSRGAKKVIFIEKWGIKKNHTRMSRICKS